MSAIAAAVGGIASGVVGGIFGGGGGGGGSYDNSAMIEQGKKALKLQKELYEDGIEYTNPWYTSGVGALDELNLMMGMGGADSMVANGMNRQGVYDMLSDQYSTSGGGMGGLTFDQLMNATNGDQRTPRQEVGESFGGRMNLFKGSRARRSRENEYYEALGYDMENAEYLDASGSPMGLRSLGRGKGDLDLDSIGWDGGAKRGISDHEGLNSAVDAYMDEYGTRRGDTEGFGSLRKKFGMEDFEADAGYQFRLDEGSKAIERAMSSRGKTFSPEALKALDSYSQGMATDEYSKAYGRFEGEKGDLYNRLANMSGMGQTATGQRLGVGQTYSQLATDTFGGIGSSAMEANSANQAGAGGGMFSSLGPALGSMASNWASGWGGGGGGSSWGGGGGGGYDWYNQAPTSNPWSGSTSLSWGG